MSNLLFKRKDKYRYYSISKSQMTGVILEGYDFAFSVRVNESFYGNRTGYIKDIVSQSGYHMMFCEGYFTKSGIKYYIVRNSWGRYFGSNGYCFIPESYMQRYVRDLTVLRERWNI